MSEVLISTLVLTPDVPETMRRTLSALSAQTIADRVEVVLIGPSEAATDVPAAWVSGFASVKRAVSAERSMGAMYVAGVAAATGPIVQITEDHCYPLPGHHEAVLAAFEAHGCAAVGPNVALANPGTFAAEVQYLFEYAVVGPKGEHGVAPHISGHNSAYRRDALLAYGDELADWLEVETLLHWEMTRRGLVLVNDAGPRSIHWNVERLGPLFSFCWVFPRVFAAYRGRRAGLGTRLKLGLLWPLIGVLRTWRTWGLAVRYHGVSGAAARVPLLFAALMVSAASEGMGYLFGVGGHTPMAFDREFHRDRYMRAGRVIADPDWVEAATSGAAAGAS
ncbi:MAG: glycosyltransferase [Planctomycetota bacterium]